MICYELKKTIDRQTRTVLQLDSYHYLLTLVLPHYDHAFKFFLLACELEKSCAVPLLSLCVFPPPLLSVRKGEVGWLYRKHLQCQGLCFVTLIFLLVRELAHRWVPRKWSFQC